MQIRYVARQRVALDYLHADCEKIAARALISNRIITALTLIGSFVTAIASWSR